VGSRKYIIAPKRDGANPAPPDWKTRLTSISGVTILGSTDNQAQFMADDSTLARVRNDLGRCCYIEESAERGSL